MNLMGGAAANAELIDHIDGNGDEIASSQPRAKGDDVPQAEGQLRYHTSTLNSVTRSQES